MNYSLVTAASSFPTESRPIYLHPIANVTQKEKDTAYPKLLTALTSISERHATDRILVHTVSYDLAKYLTSNVPSSIRSRIVSYEGSESRQRAIDTYLTGSASILIASSLDRGIDLPGDDCRAIVVCKVPYPSLGDKQVAARLYSKGGQLWYSVQTVRTLIQMTGRGVRHKDDYCSSYILDKQFVTNIWKKNRSLLPQWWRDAVITTSTERL